MKAFLFVFVLFRVLQNSGALGVFSLPVIALAQGIVSIDGVTYPQSELPFRVKNHLVLTQTGVCVGFFLANSDIVYGAKSGVPVGYLAADGFLHFSFPPK